jgi:hypothetical protein
VIGTASASLNVMSPDRDATASELLRYVDANGDGWADVIDTLTMYPDARSMVVRLLAEMDAAN